MVSHFHTHSTCLALRTVQQACSEWKRRYSPQHRSTLHLRILQNSVCFFSIFLFSNDLIELIEKPARRFLFFSPRTVLHLLRSACTFTSPHTFLKVAKPLTPEHLSFLNVWDFTSTPKRSEDSALSGLCQTRPSGGGYAHFFPRIF